MAKGNLFKAILGIGGAVAAVLVTRKDSRDKLKAEYNKYKQDPQSYKDNAKDKATQLGTIANETIKEVKTNQKEYVNRLKNNPKAFFEEEKSKFTEYDNKTDESIEKGKFDDEGGAAPNNNLRIVTEEDLKKNKNALSDKE
ncbi:YtxH domain-containing protein [Staphylococcus aureus]|nr:YtxH domain-containing protein [Staphylococcus aureus]HDT5320027.1 YtxH domain-containing protein [Staphylococcus aureus]HDZ6195095.1 YtxH domain-containing protein [Staphylococcus aureus]